MPTYDYVCDSCEHQFETFQSITAEPLKKCPECGKKKLRRLIGPGAAIVFRGSGFYKTDYRSESYKKAAAADSGSGGSGSGGSGSGSGSSGSGGSGNSGSGGQSGGKPAGKTEAKTKPSES